MRRILFGALCAVLLAVAVIYADGTSFKSINSSGDILVEVDGNGVRITPDSSFQVGRMYGFGGSLIGLGYATSPANVLALYTDDDIQFLKYANGVVWGWTMADKSLYPGDDDYSIGTLANPVGDMYGGIFHSKIGYTTFDGMTETCGSGATSITTKGGLVTDMSCASPASSNELASLRATIAAQDARLAALEAALLAGGTARQ